MANIAYRPYLILVAAALSQLWPWYMLDIGGDSLTYKYYLDCFVGNLTEGVWRPTWCHQANSGYGTPVFFLYFPFAHYLGALFFPLKSVGISIDLIFILQLMWINVLFAFTCFYWLTKHTSRSVALWLTCLLLYLPYRLELLYFRAAYAELLAIALFPLWLVSVERMIKGDRRWYQLALLVGISVLIHVQTTFLLGIITFCYVCFYSKKPRPIVMVTLAGIVGACIAAYFLLPAAYYQQFILGADGGMDYTEVAVNRYIRLSDFTSLIFKKIILTLLSLLVVVGICIKLVLNRQSNPVPPNVIAWLWTFLIAAILYSPLVGIVFDHSALVRSVFFPWRIQIVFFPVIAMLLVQFVKILSHQQKQIRIGDLLLLFLFLNLLQPFTAKVIMENQEKFIDQEVNQQLAPNSEYYSIWTDPRRERAPFYERTPPKVISGAAEFQRVELDADETTLSLTVDKDATIWLKQAYFPSWRAYDQDNQPLSTKPTDDRMGNTLLVAPKGTTQVKLLHQPYRSGPWYVRISPWISLGALLFVLFLWRRHTIDERT